MNIKPLGDRSIESPRSGRKDRQWHRLTRYRQRKPQQGKILAVGPGKYGEDGKVMPMSVKEGDTVLFAKYAGTEIKYDGEELLILKESDLLAIVG